MESIWFYGPTPICTLAAGQISNVPRSEPGLNRPSTLSLEPGKKVQCIAGGVAIMNASDV